MSALGEPPRCPQLNGDSFAHRFDHFRPHDALDLKTQPSISNQSANETPQVSYVLNPDTGLPDTSPKDIAPMFRDASPNVILPTSSRWC
jgi:hypothetical protein